jgi:hypothetical protein
MGRRASKSLSVSVSILPIQFDFDLESNPIAQVSTPQMRLLAYAFLNINGWEQRLSEAEAFASVMSMAAGEIDESCFPALIFPLRQEAK